MDKHTVLFKEVDADREISESAFKMLILSLDVEEGEGDGSTLAFTVLFLVL